MKTDVIPVRLSDKWILVRAESISEFLSRAPWLPVPGANVLIPGVMTWKGRAIPVLDLSRALNFGSIASMDEVGRVMVVVNELGVVGIPISAAREVRSILEEQIQPPHVTSLPYSAGEVDEANVVMPLIEIDQILRDVGKASVHE